MTIILLILFALAVFGSIVTWMNTQLIIRDIAEIKKKLGIEEIKKPSFLDKDLDND